MMTPEEYIATLSVEEMRYVLRRFWDWFENEGCPCMLDDEYDCGAEIDEYGERECASEMGDQLGCWLKYYVLKYSKQKETSK